MGFVSLSLLLLSRGWLDIAPSSQNNQPGRICAREDETALRKWLFVLLVLAVLYALSFLTTKKYRDRYPILRRIDRAISIVVWTLLAAYGIAFFYWLFTQVIRR
jgi:hypothetical protein